MKPTILSRFWLRANARPLSFLVLVAVLASLAVAPGRSFAQANSSDPAIAAQMLREINDWRVQQGLWPLKVNKTLEAMAISQATFIAPTVDSINDESGYHQDSAGRFPLQRAAAAPYNWPTYGSPARIEIGENAGVGSIQFSMNFWKNSDIHRRAALSNVYREIGVAAVPHRGQGGGYVFIVDFGARPGILPALLDPSLESLYVTTENSRYAAFPANGMQIRLFGTDGQPLAPSGSWQAKITIPRSLGGRVSVLYTNSTQQSVWNVNPDTDVAVMSATQSAASTPTNAPTSTPQPEVTATPSETPATAATPTASPSQASATATPAPPSGPASLILTYSAKALFIYNSSGAPLDLRQFSVGSDVGKISIASWSTISAFPTAAFPAGHCLQADQSGTEASAPSVCKFVRSIILMPAPRVFWAQGTFSVFKGRDVVTTCTASAGRCEVVWP